MTTNDVLRAADKRGLTLSVRDGNRVIIRGRADAIEELKPEIATHKPEIITALRERDALGEHGFTCGGKLCSRCRGLGRVAVVGGDLVCGYCIVTEAERLVQRKA